MGPYEHTSDGLVDMGECGEDRAPMQHAARDLHAPAPPSAPERPTWYASDADELADELYDRDEDALREQQYEDDAGIN